MPLDVFHEHFAQNRVLGMSQVVAWEHAWTYCHDELKCPTRKERPDLAQRGPIPAELLEEGLTILPEWPEPRDKRGRFATELDNRPYIIDRKAEIHRQMLAREIPDLLSYVIATQQEITARCMQAEPARTVEGRRLGLYEFKANAASASNKILLESIRLRAQLGADSEKSKTMKDLTKELEKLKKEVLGEPGTQEAAEADRDPEGTSGREDPSVSTLQ